MINFKKLKVLNSTNKYFIGIFWTITASFFSNLCDTLVKSLSLNLHSMQIIFFRLFFGTLIIFPIMLYSGKHTFFIKNKWQQFFRIIIGFCAITSWIYGVGQTSLSSITTISFSCPFIVLFLAYLFLGEKFDVRIFLSVIVGFLGVIVIAFFEKNVSKNISTILGIHIGVFYLFFATFLFALSDILNKKMISSENLLSMIFYFYFGTFVISIYPAIHVWQPIKLQDIVYLFFLGFGGISILYCILKAAHATDISAIAPYKYIELIFSIITGYLLFHEVINLSTVIGASLIIPSALLVAYYETNKNSV